MQIEIRILTINSVFTVQCQFYRTEIVIIEILIFKNIIIRKDIVVCGILLIALVFIFRCLLHQFFHQFNNSMYFLRYELLLYQNMYF